MKNISPNLGEGFWITPVAAFLMFLMTVTAFFPGYMSPDTFSFLEQAKTGGYDDLHTPGMAAVWRALFFFWDNPGSLFTFHTLLYWSFWALLAGLAFPKWWQQLLCLLTAFLPPLWSQITVVWTDSELSLTLFGAYLFGLLALHAKVKVREDQINHRFLFLLTALFFFFWSAFVRTNSFPALIPLAFFLSRLVFPKIPRMKTVFLAVGLCGLSLATSYFITYGILKPTRSHVTQLLQTYDIVGIFHRTKNTRLIPEYWKWANSKLTPLMLDNDYTPYSEVPLSFWTDSPVFLTRNPVLLEELKQKWLSDIGQYPAEFLQHRWDVFKRLLGIGEPRICYALYYETVRNNAHVVNRGDPELQGAFKTYFTLFRNTFLFRGWCYLLLLLGLVYYLSEKINPRILFRIPALCAAFSSFAYGAAYFAYPMSAEFRFLYPTVSLFFLTLILTLSCRFNGGLALRKASKSPRPKKRPALLAQKRS